MRHRDLYNKANYLLAVLQEQIRGNAGLNLHDMNIHAEVLFRDLLNLVHSFQLEGTNLRIANFPAIDLADTQRRVCVQVTSQQGSRKVKETVNGFRGAKLDAQFDRLIVLVLGSSAGRSGKIESFASGHSFDPSRDIWDKETLLKQLLDLPIERLERAVQLLSTHITEPREDPVSRELKTIMKLLTFLSSEETQVLEEFKDEPDPAGKVNLRFSAHAVFLKDRFSDLYPEYGQLLSDALLSLGLTTVNIRRMQTYLKGWSDRCLSECDGNPTVAIQRLVGELASLLKRADVDYVEGAIEFFLLDQLIKCNVFPNRVRING